MNILGYVTLVLITSSSPNSWFKLIWLHQRKQIKLIWTIFYRICLETRLLILNNRFLLFLLWGSPLHIWICQFLIQGSELMIFSSSCVWGLVFRFAWPVPKVCHLPVQVTWKGRASGSAGTESSLGTARHLETGFCLSCQGTFLLSRLEHIPCHFSKMQRNKKRLGQWR